MAGGRRLCGQWLRSASSASRMAWMSASSTSSMALRCGLHMGGLHLICSRRYSSVCCRTVLSLSSRNLIITCCNMLSPYAIPTVFVIIMLQDLDYTLRIRRWLVDDVYVVNGYVQLQAPREWPGCRLRAPLQWLHSVVFTWVVFI